jgi:SHS2 domain-containing protein
MMPRWEHFEDGAAIGVRGIGDSKAEAFAQAALALIAALADPALVRGTEPVELRCTAADDEQLLAQWLSALAHEMARRRMLFSKFELRLEEGRLSARAWGEGLDARRHGAAIELKGATLGSPRVARHGANWLAQAVMQAR